MTWDEILARVRQGETTEADAQALDLVRRALRNLDDHYPGDGGYFTALAKVLGVHRQMEANNEVSA